MNGGFGQFTRVQQIQKEILRNGPVISNMKAPRYFKFYKLGILKNDETNILIENKLLSILEDNIFPSSDVETLNNENKTDFPKKDNSSRYMGIPTDHSVMIIGWSKDAEKGNYWIVRNSFGKDWGNKGHFYVAMGQNDFGIEEEVSGYEVRMCEKETGTSKGECQIIEV